MKLMSVTSSARALSRRGAALLLSLLVLLVLVAIVIQISASTATDARIARNDIGITTMDHSIESCLLDIYDRLKVDGEAGGGGEGEGGAAAAGAGATGGEGEAGAAGGADPNAAAGPTDSRRDEWATPRREEINEIRMRALVQDEDSKINVLSMLNPDEAEAEAAMGRVVRCLDYCREGTSVDIDVNTAEAMAKAMLEFMSQRTQSKVPRTKLLTDDEQNEDSYLPSSLSEFAMLPPFDEGHFRDFRDEHGVPVHSIGSFLTVWSSLKTLGDAQKSEASALGTPTTQPPPPLTGGTQESGQQSGDPERGNGESGTGETQDEAASGAGGSTPGGAGAASGATAGGGAAGAGTSDGTGYAVNVNTAPTAVLKALFDDRVVPPRFWDKVVEYRNYEEEKEDGDEEAEIEPAVDEYGEEIIQRKIFDSLTELSEVDGFSDLDPDVQRQVNELLTTQSHVFSIYVIAHRSTSSDGDQEELARGRRGDPESDHADALVRVVRSVVWRRDSGDGMGVVPIVRWEVLDYIPFEVLDYPDEDR